MKLIVEAGALVSVDEARQRARPPVSLDLNKVVMGFLSKDSRRERRTGKTGKLKTGK
jgi:hypothetical protein